MLLLGCSYLLSVRGVADAIPLLAGSLLLEPGLLAAAVILHRRFRPANEKWLATYGEQLKAMDKHIAARTAELSRLPKA